MIQEINRQSFYPYGRSLGQKYSKRGFPAGEEWIHALEHVTPDMNMLRMTADAEVYLDYGRGMAMLLVALKPDDEPAAFYLDKPVCIRRGVYYCVLPFDESCDVHVYSHRDAQTQIAPLKWKRADSAVLSSMEIGNIRTLFYQEKEEGFYFRGESHPQYELTYMDKGGMHSIVGGHDYFLQAGEMMLYGPNQWHSQFAEPNDAVCFLTVSFDMKCEAAELLLEKKFSVDSRGVALLDGIMEESEHARVLSGDMIYCYLKQFLINTIRSAQHGEHPAGRASRFSERSENAIIDRALKYISENIYEKITVTGVARAVNVCTSYLAILFSRHLHISPSEYIRREKLEESKRLIRQGDMNFTQIADRLKYSSICHYSNQFKRKYGMTPTEYCQRIGANRPAAGGAPAAEVEPC